jgi:hypothetical protein
VLFRVDLGRGEVKIVHMSLGRRAFQNVTARP